MDEGDCYPRPRDYTPASYVELHDAVMRVNGTSHGNLKYMFDYGASPEYETGYIYHHVHDLPALRQLEKIFSEGEQVGVRVQIDPDLIRKLHMKTRECATRYLESIFILCPTTLLTAG